MHILKINDENGQTQKWWFNFLWELRADLINNEVDLEAEFSKWGAELAEQYNEVLGRQALDTIQFKNERDMTMFVLRWS